MSRRVNRTSTTRQKAELTDEIIKQVLGYWKAKGPRYHRVYLYLKLLANSGARRSEALGFFPEDLQQLGSGEWVIRFRRQRSEGKAFSDKLKTSRSYGYAILPPDLGKELSEFVEAHIIPDGKPIFDVGRYAPNKWWTQTKKALGLDPRLRLHDFCSYYIKTVGPKVFAKVENRELTHWDVEDYFRRSWKDIQKHYHIPKKPDELSGLTLNE